MDTTEQYLLERWSARRDSEAFAQLAALHAGMVYATCRRILGDSTEAEDIAQECFLEMARSPRRIRVSLAGWLHALAVTRSINHLRATRRRKDREQKYYAEHAPAAQITWNEIQPLVDEAVAQLPEKYRVPLILHYFEGRPYEEVAASLGIPKSTAAYRTQKGVEYVRELLRKKGIIVPAVPLAAILGENAAQAAPPSFTAALGRIAVAGTAGTAAPATTIISTIGAALMAKKIFIAAGIALAALLAIFAAYQGDNPAPMFAGKEANQSPMAPAQDLPTRAVVPANEQTVQPPEQPPVSPQPERAAADTASAPAASISGLVTDQDGAPFRDAEMTLIISSDELGYYRRGTLKAKTGLDGRYSFNDIQVFGHAYLAASSEGYLPVPTGGNMPQAVHLYWKHWFSVSPGTVKTDLDFMMQPTPYSVAGCVVGLNYRPIAGAKVGLNQFRDAQGGLTNSNMSALTFQLTDDSGHFEIAVPAEALCEFIVSAEGYSKGFFEGIPTGTRNALFEMRRGGSVSGRVTWQNGGPAARVLVELYGTATGASEWFLSDSRSLQADSAGAFHFENLSEGLKYTLIARDAAAPDLEASRAIDSYQTAIAQPDSRAVESFQLHQDQQLDGIELVLARISTIKGRVTAKETGQPVYPCKVYAYERDKNLPRCLPMKNFQADTTEDGAYSVGVDITSKTEVVISYQNFHFAGSGTFAEAEGSPVTIEPGQTVNFDFTVPATVDVPVRFVDDDGQPRAGLYIALRNVGDSGLSGLQEIGADGKTLLKNMTPNVTQQIVATGPGHMPIYGASEPFTCQSGKSQPEVTVVCHDVAGITAQLLMQDGTPPRPTNFSINGRNDSGSWFCFGAQSGEGGTYEIQEAVPAGKYSELTIQGLIPGMTRKDQVYVTVSVENIDLAPGAVTDLGTLTLIPITEEQFEDMPDTIGP